MNKIRDVFIIKETINLNQMMPLVECIYDLSNTVNGA